MMCIYLLAPSLARHNTCGAGHVRERMGRCMMGLSISSTPEQLTQLTQASQRYSDKFPYGFTREASDKLRRLDEFGFAEGDCIVLSLEGAHCVLRIACTLRCTLRRGRMATQACAQPACAVSCCVLMHKHITPYRMRQAGHACNALASQALHRRPSCSCWTASCDRTCCSAVAPSGALTATTCRQFLHACAKT